MLKIYKPGQGYWTRITSGAVFGTVAALAGWNLHEQLKVSQSMQSMWLDLLLPLAVTGGLGWLVFWICGTNPRTSEFMILTEGEMKKVNWSTRKEVIGATKVVVGMTVVMSIYIFGLDFVYQTIFTWIGILGGGGGGATPPAPQA